jgi:predicted  nucleic acid-binding Zn ribbon protein
MFGARISIAKRGASEEEASEAALTLLASWFRNGQIASSSWVLVDAGPTLDAYASLPRVDSLAASHDSVYVARDLAALGPESCSVTLLGADPSRADCCVCERRSGLVLFTHFLSELPPVRCLDCFDPVPLYELPRFDGEENLELQGWAGDYRACDTLQMGVETGERFGERQLLAHDGSLGRRGREVAAKLESKTGIPVYYYLHRARSRGRQAELERRCPSCGGEWRLAESLHLFDFRCEGCRLLSAIASDAA